ncbi:MAG TPA: hypothetical protein DFI01_08955 [Bacteroidales bacterium]|nr:hypothetical protein [Bacteroidales bacterium]
MVGGYVKPLANKNESKLFSTLKNKLKVAGLRIVYQQKGTENGMLIIVIARADVEVYRISRKRIIGNNL